MADKDLRELERKVKLDPNDQESANKLAYLKHRLEIGTLENLVPKLIEKIQSDPEFPTVWEIATHNCQGPIRLVGGRVYRTLIELIHNVKFDSSECDWDFLTTKLTKDPVIPPNFSIRVSNGYGGTESVNRFTATETKRHKKRKFIPHAYGQYDKPIQSSIDVFQPNSLDDEDSWFSSFFKKEKDLVLQDYVIKVPFTFQTGMLDLRAKELQPSSILEILAFKKLEYNNYPQLELSAKRFRISNNAYIELKTKALEKIGFRWQ